MKRLIPAALALVLGLGFQAQVASAAPAVGIAKPIVEHAVAPVLANKATAVLPKTFSPALLHKTNGFHHGGGFGFGFNRGFGFNSFGFGFNRGFGFRRGFGFNRGFRGGFRNRGFRNRGFRRGFRGGFRGRGFRGRGFRR